jgi:hypothetical protein
MRSEIHQYDIQLCHFIDTYWAWASQYLQSELAHDNRPSIESHYQPMVVTKCFKADTLSDQQVWDIVARWQGLAVLRDIYQNPSVLGVFCRYPLIDEDSYCVSSDGPLQIRKIREDQPDVDIQEQHSTIPPQRQDEIFPRLYLATTRYWLLCEAMRLAKICTYPPQSEENKLWNEIYAFCFGGTSLLEAIQVLEAYDFTFNFLIGQLQCAKVDGFMEWVKEGDFIYENETLESNWVFFLQYLRISLSPADILELSIYSRHWKQNPDKVPEWSPDRKYRYLRDRLFFQYGFPGRIWMKEVGESPDTSFTARDLEKAVELKLNAHSTDSKQSWQQAWQEYRDNRWVADARGLVLSWKCSDQMIANRIGSIS